MISHQSDSLDEALCKCAKGDRDAFKVVFDETQAAMFATVFKKVGERDAAKSVLQQGYVYIWQNASKFDPERGSAIAWMLVIMRSRAIDHLRKARCEKPFEEISDRISDNGISPENKAAQSKLKDVIGAALNRLPHKLRQAVEMHYFEDLTSTEIGARLKISRNTAKSRIRRGVEILRHHIPINRLDEAL